MVKIEWNKRYPVIHPTQNRPIYLHFENQADIT